MKTKQEEEEEEDVYYVLHVEVELYAIEDGEYLDTCDKKYYMGGKIEGGGAYARAHELAAKAEHWITEKAKST